MQPLLSDTSPEAEAVLIRLTRAQSVEQRLHRMSALIGSARALAVSGIRHRHPGASPDELRCRLAALLLDPETVRRVYGWDPDVEGY